MSNDFNSIKRNLTRSLQALPRHLANEAVNHSLDAFKAQSWDGQQWRRRFHSKKQGRSILIKSGRGRRSIQVISVNDKGFVYGTDVDYMAAHNEGFTGSVNVKAHSRTKYVRKKVATGKFTKKGKERHKTVSAASGSYNVKSHSRRMNLPKRQFAGEGEQLRQRLINKAKDFLLKSFK